MKGSTWKSQVRLHWVWITLFALAGVLGLTHIPNEEVPSILQSHGLDKVEHMAAYGLIASFFLLSLKRPAPRVLLLLGLAALAGIGALDETTQPFVNRTASLADYACDLAGIIVACLIFGAGKLSRFRTAPR